LRKTSTPASTEASISSPPLEQEALVDMAVAEIDGLRDDALRAKF
jgi:hypothetical protein